MTYAEAQRKSRGLSSCVRLSSLVIGVLLGPLLVPAIQAAPPTVTYLYPAGACRGTSVEVTAGGTFERWPVQVWVSGQGVEAKAAKDKGKLSVRVSADAAPGTYYIRLYDEQGASSLRPFQVGLLPDVIEKEPNDDPKKPQLIDRAAVVVNGRLEKPGDVDCFTVILKKGQTFVASLDANRTLKSPMDAVLQVVSKDGFVLAQNDDFQVFDPQIVFPVTKDDTYLVRVFAFPSTPDSSIRFAGAETFVYRLTLTTGGFADHVWPLAVSRAGSPEVRLIGWNIPPEAQKLAAPPGLASSTKLFHQQVANPVSVSLEPHPCLDLTNPGNPQEPLTPPITVSGRLEKKGAISSFAILAKKGQPLTLQLESRTLGFPLSPLLRVQDDARKTIGQAEPSNINGDCELSFKPPQDGRYWVQVRDLHDRGGARFVYRLRILANAPDYDLTLANDRWTLVPGKPLDLPVTVNRRNGFDKPIELRIEGLPAGVTAQSPIKGDNKTINLRLATEKAGLAGPIRIVGTVKDQPAFSRIAQATVAELGETTSDLWLTTSAVPAPPPKPAKKK